MCRVTFSDRFIKLIGTENAFPFVSHLIANANNKSDYKWRKHIRQLLEKCENIFKNILSECEVDIVHAYVYA